MDIKARKNESNRWAMVCVFLPTIITVVSSPVWINLIPDRKKLFDGEINGRQVIYEEVCGLVFGKTYKSKMTIRGGETEVVIEDITSSMIGGIPTLSSGASAEVEVVSIESPSGKDRYDIRKKEDSSRIGERLEIEEVIRAGNEMYNSMRKKILELERDEHERTVAYMTGLFGDLLESQERANYINSLEEKAKKDNR